MTQRLDDDADYELDAAALGSGGGGSQDQGLPPFHPDENILHHPNQTLDPSAIEEEDENENLRMNNDPQELGNATNFSNNNASSNQSPLHLYHQQPSPPLPLSHHHQQPLQVNQGSNQGSHDPFHLPHQRRSSNQEEDDQQQYYQQQPQQMMFAASNSSSNNSVASNNTVGMVLSNQQEENERPEMGDGNAVLSNDSARSSSSSLASSASTAGGGDSVASSPILAGEGGGGASQHFHYRVGMFLDIRDTVEKWCEAEVLAIDHLNRKLWITYTYWSDKFDEGIPFDSDRIAPFGSKTYQGDPATLQLHQRIEVWNHHTSKWQEAEPVEFSPDQTRVKIHYKNYKHLNDEWIRKTGDRIRPFGRIGREKILAGKQRSGYNQQHHQAALLRMVGPTAAQGRHAPGRHLTRINPNADHTRQIAASSDRYTDYQQALARQHLAIHQIEGDGNCLFRSISHQVYGTERHHMLIRTKCMEYMDVERRYFEPYVVGDMEDFLRYLELKRRDGVWGDDPEVQALCELYDRPAEIWAYDATAGAKKLRTFHEASGFTARPDRLPMMLSYYGGGHYDSICHQDAGRCRVSTEPAGVMEDRAIEMARQRQAAESRGGGGTGVGVEEMKRRSDEEATEQAAVEAALRASREDFDSFTDLETALELSAQAEIQAELLRSAAEQSEEELVKKVLEDSMKVVSVEDEMLQVAMKQSLAEHGSSSRKRGGGNDDDEQYQAAIKMSMADFDEDRQLQEVLKLSQVDARAAPFAATGPTMSTCSMMEDDPSSSPSGGSGTSGTAVARGGGSGVAYAGGGGEDPELAAAIALSLKHDVNNNASPSSAMLEAQRRNFEEARLKKEEEDLRLALEASLGDD